MSGGSTFIATDGVGVPVRDLAAAITYDGTFVSTITVVYNDVTYVQTLTNDGSNITEISQWVAT